MLHYGEFSDGLQEKYAKVAMLNFTDMEYANRKRTTRREAFLDAMESIIPWNEWMKLIPPFYVQKERGRKLIPLETMLRMYLMQNWFGLSDKGIEDAIYDSYAMKRFLKIDFSTAQTPHATTLLHFRYLLEKHDIARKMFDDVKQRLEASGLIMHGGTIVDATIIHAPSSTKNVTKSRDPEMYSTKKGNQWYFGMKIYSGADAGTGYVHTITATSANVHDIAKNHELIREEIILSMVIRAILVWKSARKLHDNGVSALIFPNFPFKWEIRGRKVRDRGMIVHCLHGKL